MFNRIADKVVSHFIFKQKKVFDDPTGAAAARRNQAMVASIILLKESVEVLPQLATVSFPSDKYPDCLSLYVL